MNRSRIARVLLGTVLLEACAWAVSTSSAVRIDFFGEPGCVDCIHVRSRVLPGLAVRHAGTYELIERDLNVTSNYIALVEAEERFGRRANATVYLLFDNRTLLAGVDEIEAGAEKALEAALAARLAGDSLPADPPPVEPPPQAVLSRRYADFTLGAVILAGLADGVNICAITTLVFFMSLLTQAGAGHRRRWALGLSFAGASFGIHFLIGLGLLQALHAMKGFMILQTVIEAATVIALLTLAMLTFRDAWRYGRTGHAGDVSLQLSAGIRRRIHDVLRRSVNATNTFWAGLTAGALVTVLEGVCTGQTYVPTLVLIGIEGRHGAWGLLALYNAFFILPLLVVLALVSFGLRIEYLAAWTRKHVVPSKLLLGLVFLLLAAMLLVLRRSL